VLQSGVAPINLADPAFEPTDEQLVELSKGAFANLREKHRAVDATVQAQIQLARQALRENGGR
jgi:hypothetical protein